jgi:two-component system phosphate regulon sensor histidine kinase PhoR
MLKFRKSNDNLDTPFDTRILDGLSDPVLIVNERYTIVHYNRAYRRIMEADPLSNAMEALTKNKSITGTIKKCLSGMPGLVCEIFMPNPIGLHFSINMWRLPELKSEGPAWAMLVLRDVTVEKKAEEMRADFVANVSHELRSPLSSLLGFIETLQGPALNDPEANKRFLGIMQSEAERMSRLIGDLLTLSKVESDEHISPDEVIEIGPIVKQVGYALSGEAEKKGMKIQLVEEESIPLILGDPDELTQVIQNLLANAINYGAHDTAIKLEIKRNGDLPDTGGDGIAIAVTNKGDGIPEEELSRITERFYRVDKGRSRSMGGTGLGLAIVKHIIGRHRGFLEIESELNKETTFKVTLPSVSPEQKEHM